MSRKYDMKHDGTKILVDIDKYQTGKNRIKVTNAETGDIFVPLSIDIPSMEIDEDEVLIRRNYDTEKLIEKLEKFKFLRNVRETRNRQIVNGNTSVICIANLVNESKVIIMQRAIEEEIKESTLIDDEHIAEAEEKEFDPFEEMDKEMGIHEDGLLEED